MTWREFGSMVGQGLMRAWPDSRAWRSAETTQETGRVYFGALEEFAAETVMVAVAAYARDGREVMPTAGMLRRRIVEMEMDFPQWGEVWRVLRRYGRLSLVGPYYDFRGARQARERQRGAMAPSVRDFVAFLGDSQVAEAMDDENGEARTRNKWTDYVSDRLESRLLAGIVAPQLPRVVRANAEITSAARPVAALLERLTTDQA